MQLKRNVLLMGALASVLAYGCNKDKTTATGQSADSILAENLQLKAQLSENAKFSAEKDSILQQSRQLQQIMDETTKTLTSMQSIDKTTVATKTKGDLDTNESGVKQANMLENVRQLIALTKETEAKLKASQSRVRQLRAQNARLDSAATEYEKTVASLTAGLNDQKAQLAVLVHSLDSLRNEHIALQRTHVALTASFDSLTVDNNTVYYIAGTKDELKRAGIIAEEGGSKKFILVGSRALQPARTLPATAFKMVDERQLKTIPLPNPQKYYRLVSRQDPTQLTATEVKKDGSYRGTLEIKDAKRFWSASKYLILVQK